MINLNLFTTSAALLLVCASTLAQHPVPPTATPANPSEFVVKAIGLVAPPPPAQDSAAVQAELAELHRLERTRTPAQVAAAQADDKEESIFIFRTVLGGNFRASDLPLTAALSNYVYKQVRAVDDPLKDAFSRPRPYQFDRTLHPVCGLTGGHNSYPSGHSFVGYLEAFTLIQIVPEKRLEILERADGYAHNRMVCGVHYLSDTAAARELAYAAFGNLLATPSFQVELASARVETRKRLGME